MLHTRAELLIDYHHAVGDKRGLIWGYVLLLERVLVQGGIKMFVRRRLRQFLGASIRRSEPFATRMSASAKVAVLMGRLRK